MNEYQQQIIHLLTRQTILLEKILLAVQPSTPPNYQFPLSEFARFNWETIGAIVHQSDRDGVAVVFWGGNLFYRRSANNKYKPAIWFSRSISNGGNAAYERLITFKEISEVDPLPEKVKGINC